MTIGERANGALYEPVWKQGHIYLNRQVDLQVMRSLNELEQRDSTMIFLISMIVLSRSRSTTNPIRGWPLNRRPTVMSYFLAA